MVTMRQAVAVAGVLALPLLMGADGCGFSWLQPKPTPKPTPTPAPLTCADLTCTADSVCVEQPTPHCEVIPIPPEPTPTPTPVPTPTPTPISSACPKSLAPGARVSAEFLSRHLGTDAGGAGHAEEKAS